MGHLENLNEFKKAKKAREITNEKYENARIKLQINCPHNNVVEGTFYPEESSLHSLPPFRVCTECGYAEEGWGCGYSFLEDKENREIKNVSREKAKNYVLGRVIDNKDHSDARFDRRTLKSLLK